MGNKKRTTKSYNCTTAKQLHSLPGVWCTVAAVGMLHSELCRVGCVGVSMGTFHSACKGDFSNHVG